MTLNSKHTHDRFGRNKARNRHAMDGSTLFNIVLYEPVRLAHHDAAPRIGSPFVENLGYGFSIPKAQISHGVLGAACVYGCKTLMDELGLLGMKDKLGRNARHMTGNAI